MLASDWSRLVAGVQPVSGSKRTSGGRRGRLLGDWSRCILTYPKPFNLGYVGYIKGHMIIFFGICGIHEVTYNNILGPNLLEEEFTGPKLFDSELSQP